MVMINLRQVEVEVEVEVGFLSSYPLHEFFGRFRTLWEDSKVGSC